MPKQKNNAPKQGHKIAKTTKFFKMQSFLYTKPKIVDNFNFDHYNRAYLKAQQNFI